jgi:hypothetical protein
MPNINMPSYKNRFFFGTHITSIEMIFDVGRVSFIHYRVDVYSSLVGGSKREQLR